MRNIVAASIGIVCALLLFVTHEVLGHCVATVLLGVRVVHLTSVDSSYAGPAPVPVARMIASAGIIANIIAGVLAVALFRALPGRARTSRFFCWYYGHLTLFMGTAYLAGFAFLPFGDVHAAIAGLPNEPIIRIVLLIAGAAGYAVALRDAERVVPGSRRDVVVAYVATGCAAVAAGLFNPAGPIAGLLWSAAATFGSGYGLIAAAASRGDRVVPPLPSGAPSVRGWSSGAAVALIVLLLILGPGIPR